MVFEVNALHEIDAVSEYLIQLIPNANVFAFYGEMGAGKTTLIKNVCRKLGVLDEVNSPTFSLVNEYLIPTGKSIYHFDFYRIQKLEEAFDMGYENYFFSDSLCLIEWPEMVELLLPQRFVKVSITLDNDHKLRFFTIQLNY